MCGLVRLLNGVDSREKSRSLVLSRTWNKMAKDHDDDDRGRRRSLQRYCKARWALYWPVIYLYAGWLQPVSNRAMTQPNGPFALFSKNKNWPILPWARERESHLRIYIFHHRQSYITLVYNPKYIRHENIFNGISQDTKLVLHMLITFVYKLDRILTSDQTRTSWIKIVSLDLLFATRSTVGGLQHRPPGIAELRIYLIHSYKWKWDE